MEFWLIVGLGVSIAAVRWVLKAIADSLHSYNDGAARSRQAILDRSARVQLESEKKALALAVEFPQLSDEEIALLMRDELINMRTPHVEYFNWAVPETVGRMRRTLLVEAVRRQREKNSAG
jgi:hypothetical protein